MKKPIILTTGLIALGLFSNAQIYSPLGDVTGTSNDTKKVIMGPLISPSNYGAQLLINTKINNKNSLLNGLEFNYTYAYLGQPGGTYIPPSLSVIKALRWNPYAGTSGEWMNVFDLKADGNLFLGTTLGDGRLNVGGTINLQGSSVTRAVKIADSYIGWKANSTLPAMQDFSIRYFGDATNPARHLITFKPTGGVNINSFLNPDVNLAIGSNFTPEARVHIKTFAPTGGPEPLGVYGLIVENTGWRAHDFAFEVRSYHGPVFSVSNSGHVLIGQQANGEINKSLIDLNDYSLYVARGIRTESIRVDVAENNGWADYVFEDTYNLMSLEEVKLYIDQNGHLPGLPSAEEVVQDGIDLAEMNKLLLAKIEELYLHVIEIKAAQK